MVFDYVAGKLDWLANDLPFEGELKKKRILGDVAEREVPTCFPGDSYGSVRQRLEQEKNWFCVVTNDSGIVLGLVKERANVKDETGVEEVMEAGPTTFRPHTTADEAAKFSRRNELDPILVTSSDGGLVGIVRARDLG